MLSAVADTVERVRLSWRTPGNAADTSYETNQGDVPGAARSLAVFAGAYSVTAFDRYGNATATSYAQTSVPVDDRYADFRGVWTANVDSPHAWLGTLSTTRQPGASASWRATSQTDLARPRRQMLVLAERGPAHGRVTVDVNGRRVATLDTAAQTTQHRAVLWSGTYAGSNEPVITVTVLDTPGRNLVSLDGFADTAVT